MAVETKYAWCINMFENTHKKQTLMQYKATF